MSLLVTGGAGFIGSHLIDALIESGNTVVCIDDLSLGTLDNISHHMENPHFTFIKQNLLDTEKLNSVFAEYSFQHVFHMAANSDIQEGARNLQVDLDKTFMTTFSTLSCMRNHGVKNIVFASSSAIYGEHTELLHENSGPLLPISFYGAAKLSAEAYISAFCENFGMRSWIFRFPNVVGERSTHGAMYDFIHRLENNSAELTILGDGTQNKPYLYVKDLIEGILFAWGNAADSVNCFNLGVDDSTTVTTIARIVCEEMGHSEVSFIYTGGDRGWIGDVPSFRYSLDKIHSLGWKARRSSDDAVRHAVRAELKRLKGVL